MSAVGTAHIIWIVPTALVLLLFAVNGLKPVATKLVEPMALDKLSNCPRFIL